MIFMLGGGSAQHLLITLACSGGQSAAVSHGNTSDALVSISITEQLAALRTTNREAAKTFLLIRICLGRPIRRRLGDSTTAKMPWQSNVQICAA
jgi:hypothetical protein